jgi:undecaprenyl-phosphate 4-deoxy-4-formamido-L-arabinose transferase
MVEVSVVVPVFNSEGTLGPLCDRLDAVLQRVAKRYEVILVDDGSVDRSWSVIEDLARGQRARGIRLCRNYGQHNALLCGIRAARYGVVVTIDDDLQNPPEEIPRLLEQLTLGHDVVYGTPQAEQHGLLRDIASQITKIVLQQAMGSETARMVSAFRVFRTDLRNAFDRYSGSFVSIDVLLTWATTRFIALRVKHEAREVGISNYTVAKLLRHALNMMTGFSVMPLQLASVVGFAFTLFGAALLAYVAGRYVLQGTPVPGFTFLASTIVILSGAQLFSLGIIGEYLARMHFRIMDKPAYAVRVSAALETERDE